jgi:hypothetical protein
VILAVAKYSEIMIVREFGRSARLAVEPVRLPRGFGASFADRFGEKCTQGVTYSARRMFHVERGQLLRLAILLIPFSAPFPDNTT